MVQAESKIKQSKYKWWKDTKMIGTILLIIAIVLLIFSFVKVPIVSSINGYTIGMLIGFYSPMFYGFVIIKSLIMIFGDKIKIPKWFKLDSTAYWIVSLSIIFISSSSGFYQSKVGFTSFGGKAWSSIEYWYDSFTVNETVDAWVPKNTNGGVLGALFFAITASILSGIGTLILSVLILTITVSFLLTGSAVGLHKDIMKKKKIELIDKEIVSNKIDKKVPTNPMNIDYEDNQEAKNKEEDKKNDISFPFDDPF